MAFEGNPGPDLPFVSALAIAQHLFVEQDTAVSGPNNVKLATAGAMVQGITITKTTAVSQNVTVRESGTSFLTVNGNSDNIAAGDRIKSTTAGIGIKTTTDTNEIGATALEAATSDGVKIMVRLAPLRTLAG
ncbi:hypothetical protein LCGC14_2687490 [marine sediment metagenome]|uniref:Uncharacterized protein n=1 Tax=marine sediment metagenome TaxID=412755 RepID=A0A0F9A708_9ZZZZ